MRVRQPHTPPAARQPAKKSRFEGATPLSTPLVRRAVGVALALSGLFLLAFISGARLERQDIGHVGVVRNGGPFDNRSIRMVLMPGANLTWAGWYSQKPHEYPAHGVVLLYTVTSEPGRGHRPGADVVTVPTRDGVQVGIEGTVYYHFVAEQNLNLLKQFDMTFGTRKYSDGGAARKPYEGEAGFQATVETVFRPVLDNDLRREVGAFQCAQIVTACALVRPISGTAGSTPSNRNMALVEDRINKSLEDDLADALGGRYFVDVHFRLARVTLPQNVQTAVTASQAASANVQVAKQQLRQGRYEAKRNQVIGNAYNRSPGLANINAIKAAPRQSTVIINTTGKSQPLLLGT
jgi:regulator of protease activity HflC (stomatin/prohibitin superfamily)